jgi:glutaredoxin
MKVQLLVSEWCKPCDRAEEIWREVADMRDLEFEVLDLAQPEGRELARRLGIRTIPSVVIDGTLKAIGVQTKSAALELVARAPPRARAAVRHVGLVMETSSRAAVLAAMAYLFVFGTVFVLHGGLPQSEPPRLATIHLFTLGFIALMIYGLGEHLLPRFTGNPIRFGAWAWVQQGLAHLGLLAFAAGSLAGVRVALSAGATLSWLALLVFTMRILAVLWPRGPHAQAGEAGGRLTGAPTA